MSTREWGPGHNLLSNNCEHFASWALFGMPISGQVAKASEWARLLTVSKGRSFVETDLILSALGYKLRTRSVPLETLPFDTDEVPPLPIDLARAYWAEDRDRVVVWLPLWDEGHPAFGGRDRPWALGGLGRGSEWQASAPSIALVQTWHATLIAFPDGSAFWLTNRGEWRRQREPVLPVLERRLAPTARILEEMHSGPGRLARAIATRLPNEEAAE